MKRFVLNFLFVIVYSIVTPLGRFICRKSLFLFASFFVSLHFMFCITSYSSLFILFFLTFVPLSFQSTNYISFLSFSLSFFSTFHFLSSLLFLVFLILCHSFIACFSTFLPLFLFLSFFFLFSHYSCFSFLNHLILSFVTIPLVAHSSCFRPSLIPSFLSFSPSYISLLFSLLLFLPSSFLLPSFSSSLLFFFHSFLVAVALRNQKVSLSSGDGRITQVANTVTIPTLNQLTICFEVQRITQKQVSHTHTQNTNPVNSGPGQYTQYSNLYTAHIPIKYSIIYI